MDKDDVGKYILDAIGIDKFIAIRSKDLINIGGTKWDLYWFLFYL